MEPTGHATWLVRMGRVFFAGWCSLYTDCTGQGNEYELIPNRSRRGPIWSWVFVDLYRLGVIGAWSRKLLWSFAVCCGPLRSLLCSFAVLYGPSQFFAAPCCPKPSFAVLCYAPLRSFAVFSHAHCGDRSWIWVWVNDASAYRRSLS